MTKKYIKKFKKYVSTIDESKVDTGISKAKNCIKKRYYIIKQKVKDFTSV